MSEILIEEGQEKVRLLAERDRHHREGMVCKVVAIREGENGMLRVDVHSGYKFFNEGDESEHHHILKDLLIGEDCEFTEEAMNYPSEYQKMLIPAGVEYGSWGK